MAADSSLIDLTLYFIVLINPLSKVFILSAMTGRHMSELRAVSMKSSMVALILLLLSAAAGNLILHNIFHVEVYALKVAGGLVIFYMGFKALTKGVFFEVKEKDSLEDMSIVPLASPLIAGPATITAAISLPLEYGFWVTATAIVIAVAVNLVIMRFSKHIGHFLIEHNVMGALIRITGLIVAAIAAQIFLSGLATWYKAFIV
jgi:multiple antibiotic resistance protein